MKSIFTILTLIFICGMIQAQIVNIPDPNFKARLLQASPAINIAKDFNGNDIIVDTNNNGEIEVSEALNVYELRVQNQNRPANQNISDLTGIESFTNLEFLNCRHNSISNINISQNINLKTIWSNGNAISTIDTTQNIDLEYLEISNNELTNLDISQNINLKNLRCSVNNINMLDVSQNSGLIYLNFSNNQISNIDVTQNINLTHLTCSSNHLTSLDISQNNNLELLICSNNQLTELDLSNHNELIWWSCNDNQITNINIKNGGVSFDEDAIFSPLNILNNPIEFICADEEEILAFQEFTDYQGPISSYCSFVPGGDYNTILGNVKLDLDNSGCDDSDYEMPNLRFSLDDGASIGSSFSNQSGNYIFYTEVGNYQLTPELENPSFFNISPLNPIIDFTDLNNTTNQDFCITANGVHNDVEILIIPTVPARPGFDAEYQLVYKNKGNQVLSGSIDFAYDDSVLDLISTSEALSVQDPGNLSWDYLDLNPFESRVIDFVLNVNSPMETPSVNIDDVLEFTATINPVSGDEIPDDNVFNLEQVVVGAYDPNDIICLEGDIVSPDIIGEYLHYNVRFENTGTAAATFVVIRDDIDEAQYDLSTLQILNSSHDMYSRITGNSVEFIFDDINLAPAETGNVLFKIKSLDTLNTGDDVSQQAEIYFDYNFPIITNIAQTNFQVLSIDEVSLKDTIKVYPNPTTDYISITSRNLMDSIKVYDIQGRLTYQQNLNSTTALVNIMDYRSGIYFIEVQSPSGIITERLIKK
ncbi:T9SS type A sorting domain-containing protein [uncultured Winogradskyella sp.]|uniref:DUF7619 domain-containing protein n=1 Tax=uncultured Winogradskyella sp. TaxID=395353 RepID=UPI0026161646|nr:T9SS type A sorting domain-containing protein [uncultured Winogradskyella sp.]